MITISKSIDESPLPPAAALPASNHALADPAVAVAITHLSKTYPVPFRRVKQLFRRRFKPPVEALRDVSFNVREGEIFGLIGPNGAGKTTLTKIVATLIQPTSGRVTVKGFDSVRDDEQVRRRVGLAGAEERSFYFRLTAEQNLLFFARLYGLKESLARKRIRELCVLFELEELSSRRFAELSTGNKQRLALARAMLASPPVLLLDEPTRSLDPIAASRMRATIKSLAQSQDHRVTVFFTSHNLAEVEELCDRVGIISQGRIRALDSPKNLRALHTQKERVSLAIARIDGITALRALAGLEAANLTDLTIGQENQNLLLSFPRASDDELLDLTLRALQEAGAQIRSVETRQATLLEVLESYEDKDKPGETH